MMTIVEIRRARLWELVKQAGSQAELARRVEKDKNQINQWLGRGSARDMENDTARMFEDRCGKPRGWMDKALVPTDEEAEASIVRVGPDDGAPLTYVDKVTGAHLSAGSGEVFWEADEVQKSHSFRADYMIEKGLNPKRCKVWKVRGESMEPRYSDGDVVLIDMGDREPKHGKVFAVVDENELRLKQLLRKPDAWYLHSFNDDKRRFPDEPVTDGNFAIIGRVRWRGGDED